MCFYVRVLHFVSLWINGYVIAVNDIIDKEECQTVNTQKDDNYHKISQAKAKAKD